MNYCGIDVDDNDEQMWMRELIGLLASDDDSTRQMRLARANVFDDTSYLGAN